MATPPSAATSSDDLGTLSETRSTIRSTHNVERMVAQDLNNLTAAIVPGSYGAFGRGRAAVRERDDVRHGHGGDRNTPEPERAGGLANGSCDEWTPPVEVNPTARRRASVPSHANRTPT